MIRIILLVVTVISAGVNGMAFGNEQHILINPAQVLDQPRQLRVAFAKMGDWSAGLLQEAIAFPNLNDLVELPELSLRIPQRYAASDAGQESGGSEIPFSKATEKIKLKKKNKPLEEEFAKLPFKEPNEIKPWRQPLGWTFVGVGGAAIIAGGGCLAGWLLEDGKTTPDNDKINKLRISTIVLGSAGAIILITGVALLLWEEYAPIKTEIDVGPGFAGMSIRGSF